MRFVVVTALLLCSLSWVTVLGSDFQTVEVQSGESVILECSNMTKYDGLTFWFRLVNRTKISCITAMSWSHSQARFCDGYSQEKFSMGSKISYIFLEIQSVKLDDSGPYFCGFYVGGHPTFSVIHLKIQDHVKCDGTATVVSLILGAVAVFLVIVIIGLVVQNKKLQRAEKEQSPEQCENEASADLNYAAVTFQPKARRREPEPNVVYVATR